MADLFGYGLVKVMHEILWHAGRGKMPEDWMSLWVTDSQGRLAPNVIVSRRSYSGRHALLLHNRDHYPWKVRISIPGRQGTWNVNNGLDSAPPMAVSGSSLSKTGIEIELDPAGPAVWLLKEKH